MAILGGLIGNGSYYIVSEVIKNLLQKLKANSKHPFGQNKRIIEILSNTEKRQELIKYIADYYGGVQLDEQEVQASIDEEVWADIYGDMYAEMFVNSINNGVKPSKEEYLRVFRDAKKKAEEVRQQKPSMAELSKLFMNLSQKPLDNEHNGDDSSSSALEQSPSK
ncbi:MAG: hypothetical protein ACRYFX_03545 [Janthinobacterium lividum]